MDRVLHLVNIFLSIAISASVVHHLAVLSPVLNNTMTVFLLLVVLLWICAFLADDWFCKKLKVNIETFRFAMIAIAVAVISGLVIPTLPSLLSAIGGL